MAYIPFFRMFATPDDLAAGSLLLANPLLADPNFKRTVVLLTEHGPKGSLGFVLSRPAGHTLAQVTDSFGPLELPLYVGGPVELNTLHALHRLGAHIPGSTEVAPGIFWAGNVPELLAYIAAEESPETDYRLFIGYSGWGEGQLASETDDRSWIATPATASRLWSTPPEDLWRETLRSLGEEFAIVANFPQDPRWN